MEKSSIASSSGRHCYDLRDVQAEIETIWATNNGFCAGFDDQLPVNSVPQNPLLRSQSETPIASFSWPRPIFGQPGSVYNGIMAEAPHTHQFKKQLAERGLTRDGSIFFRTMISKHPNSVTNIIYQVVFDHMFDFMMGEFGNFLFAKVIENCDEPKLVGIVEELTSDTTLFVTVVCNKYGSESVKRLIKVLAKSPLVYRITSVIGREFKGLMTDWVGQYVVFKCFQLLKAEQNKELYELLVHNWIELATDQRGCLALNASIDYLRPPYRNELFSYIADEARFVSTDPYGNYVLKKVMGLNIAAVNQKIFSRLKGNFVDLCTHRGSSFVVDTCLNCDFGMNYVLQDFIECDKLWKLARHHYGNYVLQSALKKAKCANSPFYAKLVAKLQKDKEKLRVGHGWKIHTLLVKDFDSS